MSRPMADTAKRRARRQFTDDFKAGVVRLVLDDGKTVGAVARDMDLTETAVREWVKRTRADRTRGRTGLTTAERDELARLRKENRELRTERDILKNVWSAPLLQGSASSDGEAVCVNVSGLLVERRAPGLDGIRAHRSS
jgi:transposase